MYVCLFYPGCVCVLCLFLCKVYKVCLIVMILIPAEVIVVCILHIRAEVKASQYRQDWRRYSPSIKNRYLLLSLFRDRIVLLAANEVLVLLCKNTSRLLSSLGGICEILQDHFPKRGRENANVEVIREACSIRTVVVVEPSVYRKQACVCVCVHVCVL